MKVGTTAETNEKKKKTMFGIIFITILCAIVFAVFLQLFLTLLIWIFNLIITHWIKILIGIVVILLGRRILFRAKRR